MQCDRPLFSQNCNDASSLCTFGHQMMLTPLLVLQVYCKHSGTVILLVWKGVHGTQLSRLRLFSEQALQITVMQMHLLERLQRPLCGCPGVIDSSSISEAVLLYDKFVYTSKLVCVDMFCYVHAYFSVTAILAG